MVGMNGILYVDKPKGMTSFDLCRKLRRVFGTKKTGHTGTLDPNATGVMIVLGGSATKAAQFLVHDRKEYIAEVKLGISTDTLDFDGNVLEERSGQKYEKEALIEVLKSYLGKSKQIPPMTSAIKVDGKKLYEYQRQGKEVDVEKRDIEVYSLELIDTAEDSFTFRTEVSSGTYIRALVRDILNDLGMIGTLKELRRMKAGNVDISMCQSLEEILNTGGHLHDVFDVLSGMYPVYSYEPQSDILNGKKIHIECEEDMVLIADNGEALAMYEKDGDVYRCVRGLL